jgi:hydrogenase maturation protease
VTPGSADRPVSDGGGPGPPPPGIPPLLVLGLGNLLLHDDGLGLTLLRDLESRSGRWGGTAEFVDGGTQGQALLGWLEGRRALLILDAVALGAPPGTVHVLLGDRVGECMPGGQMTAHGGNAGDLLRVAALLDETPGTVAIVGIEPAVVKTGEGLSAEVTAALPEATQRAAELLDEFCKF